MPIVSDASCLSDLSYGTAFSPSTMLCAGNATTDTCQGDSGGPLMVARGSEYVLAGITSWGYGCADARYPGVYTRIGTAALNGWIRDRIPTAAITSAPATPDPGDTVQLTASATKPASQPGDRDDELGPGRRRRVRRRDRPDGEPAVGGRGQVRRARAAELSRR